VTRATGGSGTRTSRTSVAFWVTLARASLAVALVLALLLQPDKTRPMLANFIGGFWLAAGVMSLRWSASGEHSRRASRTAGVIGVIAGLLVLGRSHMTRLVSEPVGVALLGVIAILTGSFHVMGQFERAHEPTRQRPWTSVILGVFEIVLGVLLLTSYSNLGKVFYLIATGWAFTGAAMLLGDALRLRKQQRRERAA
jgi:uncharacterized membrane protein HdeD (DUF308 family)